MELILASTSPYRRRLLQRLEIPFRCCAPGSDESPLTGEGPEALVSRLALAKARAVAQSNPGALVIGSDQVAALDGQIMGKPGSHRAAVYQLQACSGRVVQFHTALALVGPDRGYEQFHVEPFTVEFRHLTEPEIESYLRREQPYDCAGSFKCEGLGIALFKRMIGEDPTALEGLPLIALTSFLRGLKLNPLMEI